MTCPLARATALALPLLAFGACADGGDEDQLSGDLTIARSHHVVGAVGALDFAAFPVVPGEFRPLAGRFDMATDSHYGITLPPSARFEDTYFLDADGGLSLRLLQSGAPTLVYGGGYALVGDSGSYFFTDRVTGSVGLYFGVPISSGTPVLAGFAGDWHLLSLQVLFSAAGSPSVHEVGRAFAGSVTIAADGTFTGQGSESLSPAASLPATGTLGVFQDGEVEIGLELGNDAFEFEGGGTTTIIAGAELDETTDRRAGLCAFVAARATPPDLAALAGVYEIGAWFLVVDPAASGTDAALGTLELNAAGQFRIRVRNNVGDDLEYDGDLALAADGAATLDVVRPDETWRGALAADDQTLLFVDNHTPADSVLRFFVAIRRKDV